MLHTTYSIHIFNVNKLTDKIICDILHKIYNIRIFNIINCILLFSLNQVTFKKQSSLSRCPSLCFLFFSSVSLLNVLIGCIHRLTFLTKGWLTRRGYNFASRSFVHHVIFIQKLICGKNFHATNKFNYLTGEYNLAGDGMISRSISFYIIWSCGITLFATKVCPEIEKWWSLFW